MERGRGRIAQIELVLASQAIPGDLRFAAAGDWRGFEAIIATRLFLRFIPWRRPQSGR